jgi:hypothetical protein
MSGPQRKKLKRQAFLELQLHAHLILVVIDVGTRRSRGDVALVVTPFPGDKGHKGRRHVIGQAGDIDVVVVIIDVRIGVIIVKLAEGLKLLDARNADGSRRQIAGAVFCLLYPVAAPLPQ